MQNRALVELNKMWVKKGRKMLKFNEMSGIINNTSKVNGNLQLQVAVN